MDLPQYTLRPNTNRMVVPWIFKLLGLSIIFYGGIYFNIKYALKMEIPPIINLLIFLFLILLIVTQIILYRIRFGKQKYEFFTDRIDFEAKTTKTFMFNDFTTAELKQGVFDKMFNTGSIQLSKKFSVGPVSNVQQVKNYLEQLIQYYRNTQERYRAQQQQADMQRQMAQSPQYAQAAAQPNTQVR